MLRTVLVLGAIIVAVVISLRSYVHAYDFDREINFMKDAFKIWQETAHKYAIFHHI